RCPDERWVRQAVAARLGFDPFQAEADIQVEVRISQPGKGLAASIQVTRRDGQRLGHRDFTSVAGDCPELASAVELAIAIAVDPQYLARPAQAAAPQPPLPSPPAPPPQPPPAAPAPVENGPDFHASAGLVGSLGLSPSMTPGAVLAATLTWTRFSLGLEARADLASTASFGTGRVTSSVLLGAVAPCVLLGRFGLCALVSAGAIQITGQFGGPPRRESSPLVLAGVRGTAEFPISRTISLAPFADAQAVVTRTTVLSDLLPVWVTSPVTGTLGLSVDVRFF
ncbi:MAG: hypothetical protein ACYC8T_28780, partial [Myxococcaceae bacterium]